MRQGIGTSMILLVGLGAGSVAGCGHTATAPTAAVGAPQPVSITVAAAQRRPVETSIEVVGTLKGWEDIEVGAKKSGQVVKTLHDVGDRVGPDELLVELDPVNAELMVQQAEKRLRTELARLGLKAAPPADFDVSTVPSVVQAKVAIERAQKHFERQQTLQDRNVNTLEAFQNAELDLKDAEASYDNAMLTAQAILATALASAVELDVARQARRDLDIRAPEPSHLPPGLSGPVVYAMAKRAVSEGQMIREGEAVARLVIENPLRLWANVPERFNPDVQAGQEARIAVPAYPDKTFAGKVAWVNPAIDSASRTFQVEVAVPNAERLLRPGGFAKVSIVARQRERTVVPVEAVMRTAGVTKLFVVRGDKAFAVPVEVGLESGGWIEVQGDVAPDARVVTTGHSRLSDAVHVMIRGGDVAEKPVGAGANRRAAQAPPEKLPKTS